MNVDIRSYNKIGKSGLIIFDGSCGVCSVFIGERKTFFEKYGFTIAPLQESWIPELTGLDEATLLQSIHLFTPQGEILRGPDFFHYVSGKIWWLRPIHLILQYKFLKSIFSNCYYFIAKRRRRISRVCGLQSRAKYNSQI